MSGEKYTKLFDLTNRNAIVTGGAGILGHYFCDGLAEFGANIVIVDRDPKAMSALAESIKEKHRVKVIALECDITVEDQVNELIRKVEKDLGGVHILHNNAASKTSDLANFFRSTEEFRMEDWREIMSVNVDAMFMVARACGASMIRKSIKGSIIQTGSIYGVMAPDLRIYEGSEYMGKQINSPAVYSTSKAAVVGLTKYLASLWGGEGIRVNTLVPGGVGSGQNKVFHDKYSARIPMGRMARAEEMVGALVYLASDASSYTTGQTLMVDGGLSAW